MPPSAAPHNSVQMQRGKKPRRKNAPPHDPVHLPPFWTSIWRSTLNAASTPTTKSTSSAKVGTSPPPNDPQSLSSITLADSSGPSQNHQNHPSTLGPKSSENTRCNTVSF